MYYAVSFTVHHTENMAAVHFPQYLENLTANRAQRKPKCLKLVLVQMTLFILGLDI